jgi:hypothetical protein
VSAEAAPGTADERLWLKRAVLVLVAPRRVFELLRDDTDRVALAREEAVLALVLLGGVASVLATPTYGRLMEDVTIDGLLVAVIAFVGGGVYGAVAYWGLGLVVRWAVRALGGRISYRQARHVVAFASAPLALTLVIVWPVRLAIYGEDLFRKGGSDQGAGNAIFVGLELAAIAWALALLVLGARIVSRR